jgi:hypothetical protein
LGLFELLVLILELQRSVCVALEKELSENSSTMRSILPTDLLNEFRELFRALGCDCFDVTLFHDLSRCHSNTNIITYLENKKVLGFDENILFFEGIVVLCPCHDLVVEPILGPLNRVSNSAIFIRKCFKV